jgi:hypothetical protein
MTLCKCGEEYDICCDGVVRCPNCDGPCLGCYDGPGPGEEDDDERHCCDCGKSLSYDDYGNRCEDCVNSQNPAPSQPE